METKIRGITKALVREVIQADMSMHEAQIEAWKWISEHRPRGEHIPKDIMEGLPRKRYLAMNEVNFKFKVKPVHSKTFFQRLKLGFRIIFGLTEFNPEEQYSFEFADDSDKSGQSFELSIKRLENGKVDASYKPADKSTENIMS